MAFLLDKKKGAKKLVNAQYLRDKTALQVLSIHRIVSNVVYQLWRYVKGFAYTSDGKAMMTKDGRYFKFKDQQ